mgnify:CR=1 FL=1
MGMEQNIFRNTALRQLSSPDQLDQLIRITSPRAWLALLAVGLLVASAVTWGFMGIISTKGAGQGILLNNGGVYTLESHITGPVTDVRFAAGDAVNKGDVIARIDRPELVEEIHELLGEIQELRDGQQTDSDEYRQADASLKRLRARLDYESRIVSPISGRILKMNIHKGTMVQQGTSLAALEQDGGTVRLEAVLYLPASLGGELHPGMEAQVSPVNISREKYGYMLGRVISVAKYPETAQSLLQTLGNENLAAMLSGRDASLQVRVELIVDSTTASGYKWSSPAGPPISISSGALVQGEIVIRRERPIERVIPFLFEEAATAEED